MEVNTDWCPLWVKTRSAQAEHFWSANASKADTTGALISPSSRPWCCGEHSQLTRRRAGQASQANDSSNPAVAGITVSWCYLVSTARWQRTYDDNW